MNVSQDFSISHPQAPHCHAAHDVAVAGRDSDRDLADHHKFVELLEALRRMSHHELFEHEPLPPSHKRAFQTAVLMIGAILADIRTLLAGEALPELPRGCLAGLEFELLDMDFRNVDGPIMLLMGALACIHQEAETLHGKLLHQRSHACGQVA